jgi:hypothetical protein
VVEALVAKITNKGATSLYSGAGACYIEFGGGRVGKVEVDFFSGPKPTGKELGALDRALGEGAVRFLSPRQMVRREIDHRMKRRDLPVVGPAEIRGVAPLLSQLIKWR